MVAPLVDHRQRMLSGGSSCRNRPRAKQHRSIPGSLVQVHILSRTPTMDPVLQQKLVQLANETLGLNQYKLPYNATHQAGCW